MFKSLFKSSSLYLTANLANSSVPFILLPVLTRVLEPADYGLIAMFTVTVAFFSAFTGLSAHGAVGVRYFTLESRQLAEFVFVYLIILAISTASLVGVVFLMGGWLEHVTRLPRNWLLLGAVISGFQVINLIRLSLWQVADKPLLFSVFQICQSLINLGLSLYLVLKIGLGWEGRLYGQGMAILIFGIWSAYLLYRAGFLASVGSFRGHAVDALRFGLPLIPHVVGGLIIISADRYMLAGVINLASAGIYMVGLQVGQILGILTDAFNKAYAPWLMRQLSSGSHISRVSIVRGTFLYFVTVISLALIMGALAPMLVIIIAGDAYGGAIEVVLYVALGFAFSGCYLMVTNYLFFESKTGYLSGVTFFTGVCHIGLSYFLITRNGIVGAGQAFAVSQFMAFVGTWYLSNKVHPMPWVRSLKFS
ncbi:oligosaccharide flippase family protein [Alphaproteobacteria bacterium]|nr:oligosaccharide flippase family protein [Alphaproteobacteria bacterium]